MEITASATYLHKGYQVQNNAGHHTLISDRMREVGGTDLGPDSMQLLMASFATSLCSSAVSLAKKENVSLKELSVSVKGLVYPEYIKQDNINPFNKIEFSFHLKANLSEKEKIAFLKRAQETSMVYHILQHPTALTLVNEENGDTLNCPA